ncbi:MAG: PAS domain S-box protein [Chloroflexi bacterium]|nr:PAS domain S-box protein [Chloroflexota bacterium]
MLSHAVEIGLPLASSKETFVGAQLVLGMIAITLWLFYIWHYLGPRNWLTWRTCIMFGIMPLIAILALAANNAFGFMWTGVGLDSQNPYLPLEPTYSLIYWACMFYFAVLTLAGSFLIIWNIIRRRYGYRRESIYLLIAAVLPLITAFIEVTGLLSFLKLPVGLTPWAACIGAIILIFNLPQFHLDQVIPVARDVIFERIGDCILVLDMQNRVLDLNPAAEQLTGYRIEDASGLSIERIWPYQSAQMVPFNKMAKEGETLVLERDGKQRSYDLHISPLTDAGGGTTSKVVLLTDITERKKAEESLRREHIMLSRTEGITHIGSWEWDIATDTVTWSDELFSIFQRDPYKGAPSFAEHPAFYHPDDMARLQQAVETAVADGTSYELELRAIRKDGMTRICTARGVAEMGPAGRPVRLAGSLQDITERKQAEEYLRNSESQYHLLADHMTDTIRLMDMNLKTTYLSPSAAKQRGFTHQEMLELPMEKQLTPESLKLAMGILSKEISRVEADAGYNPVHTLDLEYCCKDGTTVWAESKFSVIRDSSGEPISILVEARDITERKLAEENLVKSYESVKKTLNDAINTMVKIVEMRDPYTAGHQHKVAQLAAAIAGEMKLEDTRIDQLRTAAVVHDVGKMYIPSDILSRPGRLSEIEFNLIKTHAQSGYDIVRGMDFPGNIAKAVLQHHERLDGSGYPNGLKSEDTLLEAKILAVADVIEAMCSHRPYRPALGRDKALEEISKNKGKLYDPDVVAACQRLFTEKGFNFTDQ